MVLCNIKVTYRKHLSNRDHTLIDVNHTIEVEQLNMTYAAGDALDTDSGTYIPSLWLMKTNVAAQIYKKQQKMLSSSLDVSSMVMSIIDPIPMCSGCHTMGMIKQGTLVIMNNTWPTLDLGRYFFLSFFFLNTNVCPSSF
jgi:hypothetical protein